MLTNTKVGYSIYWYIPKKNMNNFFTSYVTKSNQKPTYLPTCLCDSSGVSDGSNSSDSSDSSDSSQGSDSSYSTDISDSSTKQIFH